MAGALAFFRGEGGGDGNFVLCFSVFSFVLVVIFRYKFQISIGQAARAGDKCLGADGMARPALAN